MIIIIAYCHVGSGLRIIPDRNIIYRHNPCVRPYRNMLSEGDLAGSANDYATINPGIFSDNNLTFTPPHVQFDFASFGKTDCVVLGRTPFFQPAMADSV